jgi:hypothetical protein
MKLCEHLKPILDSEVTRGNTIREVEEDAWTNAIFVVNMKEKLDLEKDQSLVNSYLFVKSHENTDPHFELQRGFYCSKCKHSIAGPY